MKNLYLTLLFLFSATFISYSQEKVKANPQRMEKRILELGEFGKNPQGGVSRVAFTDADKQGRDYIIQTMRKVGLIVRIDAAGNIIGSRAGKNNSKPIIAFGSHIDSVPMGGNYDGDVGVIGALECIDLLNEAGVITEHPLEVIVFTDEEGGLTGSKAINGTLQDRDMEVMSNSGKSIREGIIYLGGDPAKIKEAERKKGALKAFLELHIEQGAILHTKKIDIGVVEGIVGIEWWDVTFEGFANHAGTTPMNARKDALLTASRFVMKVNEIVRANPGNQVGTVGRIRAEPGAPNVIPGKVVASLEIRDMSREKILSIFKQIELAAKELAEETSVSISFSSLHSNIPAITDKRVQDIIASSAKTLGLSSQYMPSGAGHDSQDMAVVAPTGMIFVPSKDGISHAPAEFTSPQDMANGATVLFHTILAIDKAKW
ncbi:MAG: Zn-dependent hydrolase [Cyclobacteriaceae bacterium]|nr:Zn-dependent hydrolase [Cyclobacteriaceae bacterium]